MTNKAMTPSLQEFYLEVLLKDRTLQNKLKTTTDFSSFNNLVVALGKEKGYKFSEEDVRVALTGFLLGEAQKELTDSDLLALGNKVVIDGEKMFLEAKGARKGLPKPLSIMVNFGLEGESIWGQEQITVTRVLVQDPHSNEWYPGFQYIAGNVREIYEDSNGTQYYLNDNGNLQKY